MAHQEQGWPLGLRLLNARVGLARNGSVSFNTLLTLSPSSSTDSSSDLDTQSTGSFFHEKSITLGSLMGASRILELSQRSTRGRRMEETLEERKTIKFKPWLFSLCPNQCTDAVTVTGNSSPSLGHYLEAERRAANNCRRINQIPPLIHDR